MTRNRTQWGLFAWLQSAAMEGAEHLRAVSPAPPEVPQGSSAGVQLAITPATAPRAANPAAFLRNTNSIFSPDAPAEAGLQCKCTAHTMTLSAGYKLVRTAVRPDRILDIHWTLGTATARHPETAHQVCDRCVRSCLPDIVMLKEMLACHPAGTVNRQAELQSPAPEEIEGSIDDLDAKFNLSQFSPPAARRLSTGCVLVIAGYEG